MLALQPRRLAAPVMCMLTRVFSFAADAPRTTSPQLMRWHLHRFCCAALANMLTVGGDDEAMADWAMYAAVTGLELCASMDPWQVIAGGHYMPS
jgi:hypothetical protein